MQTSNFDTQCPECNQQVKESQNLHCKFCYDLLSQRIKKTQIETQILQNFLASQCDDFDLKEPEQNDPQLDLELKQLEEEQRKLEIELKTITRQNLQIEISHANRLHRFLDEAQKKQNSLSDVCQQLCFAELQNSRQAEELQRIKKIKVLQSFFELQGNKFNYNCTLDGIKLGFQNLSMLLPLLSLILKSLGPKDYQPKCISQIYIDDGILLVFEMKNGKRTRDKEINTQENAINWIRFVGDEVKNICAFLKLEEKISGNLTDLKNGKESIFELCSSLKLVMENIDQLYFEY